MMRRSLTLACLGLALGASGCSFEHAAAVDYENCVETLDAGGRSWSVQGYVHAETWTPAFLYVLPLMPGQNLEKAKQMAIAKARDMGADRIADVKVHVETHMLFLWLFGWIEHHVSATAVSPQ